ncbi:MAG: type II toxin-antitoxin system RelE/ParE family toxin, partial [Bacteroidota bacterium]
FFQYLSKNPTSGTHLGKQIYKNRLAIRSKGKGKSGGARVITYVKISASLILLLSIYDKSEKTTISDSELKELINKYLN